MSISVGQVKGNPKEASELIAVLEAENERLRRANAELVKALRPFASAVFHAVQDMGPYREAYRVFTAYQQEGKKS